MDEIVKYQNDMNKLKFKGFTQTDMDMFMALCAKMKEKYTKEIVLSFEQIKDLINYREKKKSDNKFVQELEQMNEHLMKVNCKLITDEKIIMFILFPTFEINKIEKTLTIAVNEKFIWLLNEMKNYTAFELKEFIELNSKYAKNLYRLLKQWRTQGYYIFHDLAEFRELLDVPNSYKNKYMMEKCVNVAVKEISKLDCSFQNFVCEPIYAKKRGKPLAELKFTWKADNVQVGENTTKEVNLIVEQGQTVDNIQTFEEYVKAYKGNDKPSPVAIKIAKDIEKGRKTPKETEKKNRFNNFSQRKYDFEELERLLLTTNPN